MNKTLVFIAGVAIGCIGGYVGRMIHERAKRHDIEAEREIYTAAEAAFASYSGTDPKVGRAEAVVVNSTELPDESSDLPHITKDYFTIGEFMHEPYTGIDYQHTTVTPGSSASPKHVVMEDDDGNLWHKVMVDTEGGTKYSEFVPINADDLAISHDLILTALSIAETVPTRRAHIKIDDDVWEVVL